MPKEIHVDDMTCGGCEQTVEDAVLEVDGAESASADRDTATVTVEGDAPVDELVEAAVDAGYPAEEA
ncbi:heavy-metal-associated domain-containing protein [Natronorubrum sp. FCH18a]|uniref:heavy-metal-associated domain-containing protein n=1 Tax=Natronorubrum sp. FCH18a TaxID=3447018 RepID=UPI003F515628